MKWRPLGLSVVTALLLIGAGSGFASAVGGQVRTVDGSERERGVTMSVQQPEDIHHAFTEAFNAGDLDALMSLYEPSASLAPAPGKVVTGTEAIRNALTGFLAVHGKMTIVTQRVVPAGDVALLHGTWTLVGTGADGKPVELAGRNSEMVRRQADGSWLFVIDNPYSGD